MPKVRPTIYIIKDAQKHINVAKSRMYRENFTQTLLVKIADISTRLDDLIANMPEDVENGMERAISNELNLIKKEVIKETPKIDYKKAVRAIYNCTNGASVMKAGLSYGLTQKQISAIVKKIQTEMPNSPLGLVINRIKPKPAPAVIEPQQEEDDTNYSDEPLPPELLAPIGE